MTRLADTVRVEIIGGGDQVSGVLENFTSFNLSTDITQPSEAAFELGDDGTFASIGSAVEPGQKYRVFMNDRLVVTGRVEVNDVPLDAAGGAVARFTVRTLLSDAMYASANPRVRVRDTDLLTYVLALYEPLGLGEDDFEFNPAVDRQLRTGTPTAVDGDDFPIDVRNLKITEARIKPPETIFAAVDRQLRRLGLMHWDGAGGKIVIGFPNQTQAPSYEFYGYRNSDKSSQNNIIGMTRALDYSGVASGVGVFGRGGKRDFARSSVSSFVEDEDVSARFYRPVIILADGVQNQEAAENAAEREMTARRKNKNTVNVEMDGLSWWDGGTRTPYAINTTGQVVSDVVGGNVGAYYIHRVEQSRDATGGDSTRLTALKAGNWRLFPEAYEGKLR